MRRILGETSLPLINNVIDAGDIASAETLIPIGSYDLDKIVGELVLSFAKQGEEFIDFTGRVIRLESKSIVL